MWREFDDANVSELDTSWRDKHGEQETRGMHEVRVRASLRVSLRVMKGYEDCFLQLRTSFL